MGIEILDKLRHCEAGDVLIESGREPDQCVPAPIDGGGQLAFGLLAREVVVPDVEEEVGTQAAVGLLLQRVHDAVNHRHALQRLLAEQILAAQEDRKSTRLNSSHRT